MKRNIVIALLFTLGLSRISSQETNPAWGFKLSGFIKNDIFYDTRQTSILNCSREGHFYLYPDNVLYDINMNDVNANPGFHILNIQTRIRGDFTGPDAFGAKTSGAIEAEFFGTSENDVNGFRLRHAFVKMEWTKTSLLIGQFWHPLFPAESFPGTISFNTGAPFMPFSRNPQVKLTRKLGRMTLSLTAYSQRDFTSSGPEGYSYKYIRNSGLPGANIQIRIPAGEIFTSWAGFDYKTLRPELKTTANVETDATIGGFSVYANTMIKTKPVTISLMGIYGQNTCDIAMIGGYAVSEITDTVKQFKTYTNLNTANFWIDLSTNGKKIMLGIFTGFSKNLGASDPVSGAVYGRGSNIDHLFRISPRITFTEGRLSFAAEMESTTAAYGTMRDDGRVINTNNVSNLRFLISTIYKF